MDEHRISLDSLYDLYNSTSQGLASKDAKQRLDKYGFNTLQAKKKVLVIFKFFKQFANFFALLLIAGSFLAFFAEFLAPGQGNLYIGIALIGVVFLNAIFTFIQEYQSEKIMETFKKMLPEKSSVLRDGKIIQIESKYVVPGDILILAEGDKFLLMQGLLNRMY